MSFVSIPSFPNYRGRSDPFIANPYPGESNNLPLNPFAGNNQTIGFDTNERAVYPFEMQPYNNLDWNASIVPNMYVFVITGSLGSMVSAKSTKKRNFIATLPIVNYYLAKNSKMFNSVEDIYNAIKPLGVNTSADLETKQTQRSPNVVVNVIVQGTVDSMYNLFGAQKHIKPLSRCYFIIRKVYILPGKMLHFSLGLKKNAIESIDGGYMDKNKPETPLNYKFVYQIVPYVSESGLPPRVDGETGYFYIGRLVESTTLRDVYNTAEYDNVESLSRHTEDITAKTKLVKFFLC
jgi:hypothetical protein